MKPYDLSEKLRIGGARDGVRKSRILRFAGRSDSAAKFQSKNIVRNILRRPNLKATSATWQSDCSGGNWRCVLASSELVCSMREACVFKPRWPTKTTDSQHASENFMHRILVDFHPPPSRLHYFRYDLQCHQLSRIRSGRNLRSPRRKRTQLRL